MNGSFPSVGIATLNINQRNLIWDLLIAKSHSNEAHARKLECLMSAGLFVKNLENIQGDERDIILISTTFGPDRSGKFRQNFGPVTRKNGYKLLNVIITRARLHLAVFSSIPPAARSNYASAIEKDGNTGNGVFYAFLNYAESMAMGRDPQRRSVLDIVNRHCAESPFHYEFKSMCLLHQLIYGTLLTEFTREHIAHNFHWGGFILELAVLRKGVPVMAILTDHETKPTRTAYRMLLFKRKMLSEQKIIIYMVDSVKWFADWTAEQEKLLASVGSLLTVRAGH